MNAIQNITVGQPERLKKPVGYTILANLVNIIPFCLSIEAINIIFHAFDGSGTSLDISRLWTLFFILVAYVFIMIVAERASYRANFRGAYTMSADGRIALAEHLRKLSLGFLSRRDPGDISSMMITDFTMASSFRKMYRSLTIVFDSNTLSGKLTAAVTVIIYISLTASSISSSVSF